jgi:hypothetical protein
MTEYVWELGIDWNAIEPEGVSYLRGGLATGNQPLPGTQPVKNGDTVTFRIFDMTSSAPLPSGQWVTGIESFGIISQAAVKTQSADIIPLNDLHPTFSMDASPLPACTCFPIETVDASWTSTAVMVTVPVMPVSLRFLLTLQVRAIGHDNQVRLFRHDPEMVVGPNG